MMRICSGTYISPTEILTAAHCLTEPTPERVWVRDYAGKSVRITDAKGDEKYDLAVLVTKDVGHPYARLGPLPKVGGTVWNVGSPDDDPFIVSQGIVSAIRRGDADYRSTFFLSTAFIESGSSGGGTFDKKGRLVGVTTMTWGQGNWHGLSYSVDPDSIRAFLSKYEASK